MENRINVCTKTCTHAPLVEARGEVGFQMSTAEWMHRRYMYNISDRYIEPNMILYCPRL